MNVFDVRIYVADNVTPQLVDGFPQIFTFASLIGYAVVYTMYLKHATPQNIVIGGAAVLIFFFVGTGSSHSGVR